MHVCKFVCDRNRRRECTIIRTICMNAKARRLFTILVRAKISQHRRRTSPSSRSSRFIRSLCADFPMIVRVMNVASSQNYRFLNASAGRFGPMAFAIRLKWSALFTFASMHSEQSHRISGKIMFPRVRLADVTLCDSSIFQTVGFLEIPFANGIMYRNLRAAVHVLAEATLSRYYGFASIIASPSTLGWPVG